VEAMISLQTKHFSETEALHVNDDFVIVDPDIAVKATNEGDIYLEGHPVPRRDLDFGELVCYK